MYLSQCTRVLIQVISLSYPSVRPVLHHVLQAWGQLLWHMLYYCHHPHPGLNCPSVKCSPDQFWPQHIRASRLPAWGYFMHFRLPNHSQLASNSKLIQKRSKERISQKNILFVQPVIDGTVPASLDRICGRVFTTISANIVAGESVCSKFSLSALLIPVGFFVKPITDLVGSD